MHRTRLPTRLPEAHLAIIEEQKITQYLLATDHPAGRAKAAFFVGMGLRLQLGRLYTKPCWNTPSLLG